MWVLAVSNHKTARRLGPTANPNGEHTSGVAPHAFGCQASLGGVGVRVVAAWFAAWLIASFPASLAVSSL